MDNTNGTNGHKPPNPHPMASSSVFICEQALAIHNKIHRLLEDVRTSTDPEDHKEEVTYHMTIITANKQARSVEVKLTVKDKAALVKPPPAPEPEPPSTGRQTAFARLVTIMPGEADEDRTP